MFSLRTLLLKIKRTASSGEELTTLIRYHVSCASMSVMRYNESDWSHRPHFLSRLRAGIARE